MQEKLLDCSHQVEQPTWQQQLRAAITDVNQLLTQLELPPQPMIASSFPLRVPQPFVARMQKGNIHDPLLRQVLPLADELQDLPGYSQHPLLEQQFTAIPGLLHKYRSRVLLLLTGACAVNCRYCFRQHFSYHDYSFRQRYWPRIADYLMAHPEVNEIILSGGDPLLLSDHALYELLQAFTQLTSIRYLRIHSRLPIVIPSRITDELVTMLTSTRLKPVLVVHCNHPQEIDEVLSEAFLRIRAYPITLLNQSVILKGVNDNPAVLAELSYRLFDQGVLPYYLHVLDKVAGAAHFDISLAQVKILYQQLQAMLPGYLLPRLVQEVPGMPNKTLIIP